MLVGVGMMVLLSLGVVVVDAILTLGDNPDLVRDDGGQDNKLVTIKGESQDIGCNVNGAKTPIREIQWKKSGKIEGYSENSFYKNIDGNLLIEGHFKIEKITEDMDGMNLTCSYFMPINSGGIPSWNRWEAKVELVVLMLTIEASEEACRDGKGDLNLVLKKARKNTIIGEEFDKRIKSRIGNIFGSTRTNSLNLTYHVTLPFDKVITTKDIFEMESKVFIDGAPASCQMFRPADTIPQREIDVVSALAAAADFMGTNRSLLICMFFLLILISITMLWGLIRKEEKTPGTIQYRSLSDPEVADDGEGNQFTQDLHMPPHGPIQASPQHEGQAGQDPAYILTRQEKGEEEGKHMESSGGPK